MKKILTVFDGAELSEGVFEFISSLNSSENILLTAVFLRSIDYSMMWNYPLFLSGYIPTLVNEDNKVADNVERFKGLCENNGIEYRVHDDINSNSVNLLKIESRFADLLVLSSDFFYKDVYYLSPEAYMDDTLRECECPVLLLPAHFTVPVSSILAYDGGSSSVFAIKQFALLLPEWTKKDTYLVYADVGKEEVPDLPYIEELGARHFTNFTIEKLQFDPKKYFGTWLTDVQQPILVTGAHDRSAFSELFKESFVNDIIRENKIPVFIAHK